MREGVKKDMKSGAFVFLCIVIFIVTFVASIDVYKRQAFLIGITEHLHKGNTFGVGIHDRRDSQEQGDQG